MRWRARGQGLTAGNGIITAEGYPVPFGAGGGEAGHRPAKKRCVRGRDVRGRHGAFAAVCAAVSIAGLLRLPDYRRVWLLGGIANAMRWLEILAGTLWVFEQTGSALAVSIVVMMRAFPMLLFGAVAGALAERFDRRYVLAVLQATSALSAGLVVALAVSGLLQPWHLMAQGLVAGLSWSGEMATRRRMVADLAPPGEAVRAIAFDTLTGSMTRALGPLLGGVLFQFTGLAVAVAIACLFHLVALWLVLRITPPPRPSGPPMPASFAGIVVAARFARRDARLRLVLAMTLVMNVFGFAYAATLPAFGAEAFGVSGAAVGLLAAAEPFGALLGGLWLTLRPGRAPGAASFIAGSTGFLLVVVAVAYVPFYGLALALLVLGGLGTARFAALQTSMVMVAAPVEMRSRVLGWVTTCIGCSPFGVLAMGVLADGVGVRVGMVVMAGVGLLVLWGFLGWERLRPPASHAAQQGRGEGGTKRDIG